MIAEYRRNMKRRLISFMKLVFLFSNRCFLCNLKSSTQGGVMVGLLLYPVILLVVVITIFIGIKLLQARELTLLSLNEKTSNEKRMYHLVENSKDIIYYFDTLEFRFKYLSPSLDVFFGEGHLKDCMKDPLLAFRNLHPDDVHVVNDKITGNLDYSKPILQRWKEPNGSFLWFEEYATPIYKDDEIVAVQGIIRNVDEKVRLQKELEFQIYHDSLTGVYNRCFFDDRMSRFNEGNESVGIILCDLDNLKVTNDNYGHKAGDHLIRETAKLLLVMETDDSAVIRVGGDEFAILSKNVTYETMQATVDRILELIGVYNETHIDQKMSLSVGFSHRNSSTEQMETMYQEADQNMYADKNAKRELWGPGPICGHLSS